MAVFEFPHSSWFLSTKLFDFTWETEQVILLILLRKRFTYILTYLDIVTTKGSNFTKFVHKRYSHIFALFCVLIRFEFVYFRDETEKTALIYLENTKYQKRLWETSIKRQNNFLRIGNALWPGKQTQTFWSRTILIGPKLNEISKQTFWFSVSIEKVNRKCVTKNVSTKVDENSS